MMKVFSNIVGALLLLAFVFIARLPKQPPKDNWFKAVVVDESRPVLVKFGADWCPPCQHTDQVLDRVRSSVSHQVKIVRVDIDAMPHLARYYGVSSIPRVFLFKKGHMVAKRGGFGDEADVKDWLDQHL